MHIADLRHDQVLVARLPFIGWFSPRGLASLIFALLWGEGLGGGDGSLLEDHRDSQDLRLRRRL